VICPKCGADLKGPEITASQHTVFGGHTHFSRVIGIYSFADDATVAWQCPDCGHEWQRTEPFGTGMRVYQLVARISE
jgi:hypothetical protein